VLLATVVVVLAATRTPRLPARDQPRSASRQEPGPQPVLSRECRAVLAAADRMTSHADAAVAQLRATRS
jgi:hypothetical protein